MKDHCIHGKKKGTCATCGIDNIGSNSASAKGSTACELVDKKLKLLRKRLDIEVENKNYINAVKLDAQIFILESMWVDFIRLLKQ
jgi:hypothetical protein